MNDEDKKRQRDRSDGHNRDDHVRGLGDATNATEYDESGN